METKNATIRIELTENQRQHVKEASGQDFEVIEFQVEELEQRIAPACASGNHFPTAG